jgi:hypothetical protein
LSFSYRQFAGLPSGTGFAPVSKARLSTDIGARFGVPSAFSVLISTTGVPKYRMLGAVVTCSVGSVCVMTSIVAG